MANFNVVNDLSLNNVYSENIQTDVVILDERNSHPNNFLSKKGEFWVKNTNPPSLFYTDNTYTDYPVSGSGITLVGYTGTTDTALGVGAGDKNNITGNDNTAIGVNSLENISTGTDNTAIGFDSAKSLTIGTQNVAIGSKSMISVQNDVQNTISIGYQALSITNTSGSVAIGYNALNGQTGASGQQNTAIGYGSLSALQSGAYNTAIGYNSGSSAISTDYGTSIGYNSNSFGNTSVAIGANSIASATDSTVIGEGSTDSGFTSCLVIGSGAKGFANNGFSLGSTTVSLSTLPSSTFLGNLAGYFSTYLNGESAFSAYIAYYTIP